MRFRRLNRSVADTKESAGADAPNLGHLAVERAEEQLAMEIKYLKKRRVTYNCVKSWIDTNNAKFNENIVERERGLTQIFSELYQHFDLPSPLDQTLTIQRQVELFNQHYDRVNQLQPTADQIENIIEKLEELDYNRYVGDFQQGKIEHSFDLHKKIEYSETVIEEMQEINQRLDRIERSLPQVTFELGKFYRDEMVARINQLKLRLGVANSIIQENNSDRDRHFRNPVIKAVLELTTNLGKFSQDISVLSTSGMEEKVASPVSPINSYLTSFHKLMNEMVDLPYYINCYEDTLTTFRNALVEINTMHNQDPQSKFCLLYSAYFNFIAGDSLANAQRYRSDHEFVYQLLESVKFRAEDANEEAYFDDRSLSSTYIAVGKLLCVAVKHLNVDISSVDFVPRQPMVTKLDFSTGSSLQLARSGYRPKVTNFPFSISSLSQLELSRLTHLDINHARLGNSSFIILLAALGDSGGGAGLPLQSLNVTNNKLTWRCVPQLVTFLDLSTQLKRLELSSNPIGGSNHWFYRGISGTQRLVRSAVQHENIQYLGLKQTASDTKDVNTVIEEMTQSDSTLSITLYDNKRVASSMLNKIQSILSNRKQQLVLLSHDVDEISDPDINSIKHLYDRLCCDSKAEQGFEDSKSESVSASHHDSDLSLGVLKELFRLSLAVAERLKPSDDRLRYLEEKRSSAGSATISELEWFEYRANILLEELKALPLPTRQANQEELFNSYLNLQAKFHKFAWSPFEEGLPVALNLLSRVFCYLSINLPVSFSRGEVKNDNSHQEVTFGSLFKILFEKSWIASSTVSSGGFTDGSIRNLQTYEKVQHHGSHFIMALGLGLSPLGAVCSAAFSGVHAFEALYHKAHLMHEGVYALEMIAAGVELAEQNEQVAHALHHIKLPTGKTKWLSTKEWRRNFFDSIREAPRKEAYKEAFCYEFLIRYKDQLALLTKQQMHVLEAAVWRHLEFAFQLGFFLPNGSSVIPLAAEKFVARALDWLAYVPMAESPILHNVTIGDVRFNLSVDSFLRGPGLQCVVKGTKEKINFAWAECKVTPDEEYLQHLWNKNPRFSYQHNGLLGHRKASPEEAKYLKSQLSAAPESSSAHGLKQIVFGDKHIATMVWAPRNIDRLRRQYSGGDLLGTKFTWKCDSTKVKKLEGDVEKLTAALAKEKKDSHTMRVENFTLRQTDGFDYRQLKRMVEEGEKLAHFCEHYGTEKEFLELYAEFIACYEAIKKRFEELAAPSVTGASAGLFATASLGSVDGDEKSPSIQVAV